MLKHGFEAVFAIAGLLAVAGSVYYAYIKEKIDTSSIVSTGIIGILCLYAGGDKWILPLLIFFVGGSLASHYNTAAKRELGVEQSIRTWKKSEINCKPEACTCRHTGCGE